MKRRDFLLRSAGATLLAATPVAVLAATRGSLLEDPQAWVGTCFRLADGARIELADVEQLACDRHCTQLCLRFRTLSGAAPVEGTHLLASARGEQALFLQAGREGPVAHVNRLHAHA